MTNRACITNITGSAITNIYTGYIVFNLAPQVLHVYRGASRGVLYRGVHGTNLRHDVPRETLPV